jgi:ATP-dependent RNA helicase RhlE
MKFQELGISEPILKALIAKGYTEPTPIQLKTIPTLLEGKDMLGCAQTGTGKTAAFAIPVLQLLSQSQTKGGIRGIVLTPTRELALQVSESFKDYGKNLKLKHTVIFGGVSQNKQAEEVRRGVDIVVATPGRLLDLMNQGIVKLNKVEFLILDEADRMLDMGFIRDIRKILTQVPVKRQTLLFSATMPTEIRELANGVLKNPVYVEVAPVSTTAEKVEQSLYYVDKNSKKDLLKHLITSENIQNLLVFTRTKHGADKLSKFMNQHGIKSDAIHGNKSQNARVRALDGFKNKQVRVLVATDIAARGIDVVDLSHVVNYDLPNEPETYVHRIGRTGRAKASGAAISFCDFEERAYLKDIQRLIRMDINVNDNHPFPSSGKPSPDAGASKDRRNSGRGQSQRNSRPQGQNASAKKSSFNRFGSSKRKPQTA